MNTKPWAVAMYCATAIICAFLIGSQYSVSATGAVGVAFVVTPFTGTVRICTVLGCKPLGVWKN